VFCHDNSYLQTFSDPESFPISDFWTGVKTLVPVIGNRKSAIGNFSPVADGLLFKPSVFALR